jgi:RimJ/RimL family protein N-acetyltransferase
VQVVAVRDLTKGDLGLLIEWRNDPQVNRYLSDRLKTQSEIEVWFDRLRSDPRVWLKAILEDDRVIGYAAVESIDEKNRKCELGLIVGETDSWGRGIATQVLQLMLKYAFETLNMHRVWAAVIEGNIRSARLLKRAGFFHEGTMRESIITAGILSNLEFYSLLEDEYKSTSWK